METTRAIDKDIAEFLIIPQQTQRDVDFGEVLQSRLVEDLDSFMT